MDYFDGDLQVFDDVISEPYLNRWMDFYEKGLSFKRSTTEKEESNNVYFSVNVGYKQLIEVFDYENTIVPNAQKVCNKVTGKIQRSYINLFNHSDKFDGHIDYEGVLKDDQYYVSTVLFLNPYWRSEYAGGLIFESGDERGLARIKVENKFNRLVCFRGDLWHCVEPFSGLRARLTHYCTFSNTEIASRIADKNKW